MANKLELFEMTPEGCKLAKQYLEQIGRYEEFMCNKQSTDGFTMVAYANVFLCRDVTRSVPTVTWTAYIKKTP